MKNKTKSKITVEGGVNIWPHELHTADALMRAGYNVKFIPAHNSIHSADAYINETLFEFKSPCGDNIKCVINNLEKALKNQSKNVVIDSVRIRKIQDRSIKNHLITLSKRKKGIKNLLFIDKQGRVFDIKRLSE